MTRCKTTDTKSEILPRRVLYAFQLMLEARDYALQTDCDLWEFAVEIDHMSTLGLNLNDYRWLVRRGLVEHQREITLEGDNGRDFLATGDLTFPPKTCFVLTEEGTDYALDVLGDARFDDGHLKRASGVSHGWQGAGTEQSRVGGLPSESRPPRGLRPNWDAERRLLRVGRTTVKSFKWTAANQEAILAAFEEEGWPARIDDPLTPQPAQDPKRRLSDTIKCLNRKHAHALLHFRGDGTGQGVIWEFVEQGIKPNSAN